MSIKNIFILAILLIAGQIVTAQNPIKYTFSGKHDFYFHFPVNKSGTFEYPVTAPKNINLLGIKLNNKHLKFVSQWQIRNFALDNGQQNARILLLARENYVKYKGDKLNFTFGLQNFSWGMADRINPTDMLNPRDYTITAFETEKIPVLATTVDYYPDDNWKLQGVYIPYKQSDAIFWNNSDFIPDDLFAKQQIYDFDFSTMQPKTRLVEQEKNIIEENPEFSLKSAVAGGKINYFSLGIDLSLSYIYDFDPYYTPIITTEKYYLGITPELQTKIYQTLPANDADNLVNYLNSIQAIRISQIELQRKRIHRIGGSAKTIAGKFGLWVEAAYSITAQNDKNDFKNRGNDLFYVVGTDFSFGENEQHYVNLQYVGKWVPNYYHRFYTDYENGLPDETKLSDDDYMQTYYYKALTQPLGLQNAVYLHGFSTNVKLSFFDGKLQPSFLSYVQIPQQYDDAEKKRYADMVFMPTIDYTPGNALHLIIGAYLAYAPYKNAGEEKIKYNDISTMLGLANHYNNVYFKITYSWKYRK